MKRHEIKILETYADAVLSGEKTFEIRENDRGYQKGDEVCFKVIDKSGISVRSHSLNGKVYTITYLLHGWGIKDNWCVFSIRPTEELRGSLTLPDGNDMNDWALGANGFNSFPASQAPEPSLPVDPSTQCLDCSYGYIVQTCTTSPNYNIRCGMYVAQDGSAIIRKPTDTCIADIHDLSEMKVQTLRRE